MDIVLMRQRLIEARQFIGMNRKMFSEALGIPYRTVTNYENGSREPGSEYISKVADFCGCTTDWLLGLTDNAREVVFKRADDVRDPQLELLLNICELLNSSAIRRLIDYAEDLTFNPDNKKKA